MISVQYASGVLRRLGQMWRESFWSPFVVPFQCVECTSLDWVTRPASSTPDVVSPVPYTDSATTVCTLIVCSTSVDVSCHLVRFLDRHSTVVAD